HSCRKNDRKAQNLLFEKYKKKVLFICMRYTSNQDEAKDILQDAFIRIFKSLMSEKENILSLASWIHRITANTAVDHVRKTRNKLFTEDITLTPFSSENVTPLEALSAQEILDVIQQMPDGYRIVFNLFIIEGFDHKEIAAMLDTSETTSRSQLTR